MQERLALRRCVLCGKLAAYYNLTSEVLLSAENMRGGLASLVSIYGLLLAVAASADGEDSSSSLEFAPFPQELEDWVTPAPYFPALRWWDQAFLQRALSVQHPESLFPLLAKLGRGEPITVLGV